MCENSILIELILVLMANNIELHIKVMPWIMTQILGIIKNHIWMNTNKWFQPNGKFSILIVELSEWNPLNLKSHAEFLWLLMLFYHFPSFIYFIHFVKLSGLNNKKRRQTLTWARKKKLWTGLQLQFAHTHHSNNPS